MLDEEDWAYQLEKRIDRMTPTDEGEDFKAFRHENGIRIFVLGMAARYGRAQIGGAPGKLSPMESRSNPAMNRKYKELRWLFGRRLSRPLPLFLQPVIFDL